MTVVVGVSIGSVAGTGGIVVVNKGVGFFGGGVEDAGGLV